ncbi:DUF4249 family protein [Sphingobacterium gobiense]|uniref:DUF4249 domain-containing protein n=1 Tax=Sphingobacterium gobiense TaxID=1382456 RepID=A0A2S9JLP7_9SPHI|nr:DUF4249 family protein [Sphingobacterium gobiense]PRD54064.1 hypothetical protein C5749_11250 [Sphingobacterium gobiense]
MKRSILTLLLGLLVSFSCVRQEIIDIDGEHISPKLVVLAYLTPGDSIRIFVNKSIPFGNPVDPVHTDVLNATVILRNDAGAKQQLDLSIPSIPIYTCSQEDFPVIQGQTYHLTVSAPDMTTVTARTTVPERAATWKSATISQTNDGGNQFSGSWDALLDEQDIDYGVFVYRSAEPQDLLFGNESIIPKSGGYTVERVVYTGTGSSLEAVLVTRTKMLGNFSKMAELTREMEMYYSDARFYEIISGFKGVIPQFSNIENGLGVFGSYLLHTKAIN